MTENVKATEDLTRLILAIDRADQRSIRNLPLNSITNALSLVQETPSLARLEMQAKGRCAYFIQAVIGLVSSPSHVVERKKREASEAVATLREHVAVAAKSERARQLRIA